jgi:hypothetical protein
VLSALFTKQAVSVVVKALESAGIGPGPIAVLGRARIGRALAERGYTVIFVAENPRALRRVKGMRIRSRFDALPIAAHGLAGLVAEGIGQRDDWSLVLGECSRAVASGGPIVLVDRARTRAQPAELTRRVLCSGLAEIEQRQVGRTTVTSGRVTAYQ